jgi:ArsR family transcriptional regulator
VQRTVMEVEKVANVFKLLGDKTRLSIMGLVNENECCVCEFVEIFKMSQPSISQHLRKLKDAGLVKESRKNNWVFYSINKDSEWYPMVKNLLSYIPEQQEKIKKLEEQGLRITCC